MADAGIIGTSGGGEWDAMPLAWLVESNESAVRKGIGGDARSKVSVPHSMWLGPKRAIAKINHNRQPGLIPILRNLILTSDIAKREAQQAGHQSPGSDLQSPGSDLESPGSDQRVRRESGVKSPGSDLNGTRITQSQVVP